jgi:adenylate cyclase class 2
METEIEAKFLDINPESIRAALIKLGARQEHAEILMKRKVFDYSDERLEKIGGWVRVRDEGKKITFTYKQLNDRTLHGTKEVTVVVDDFDKTCQILEAVGLVERSYQETKREKWLIGKSEITIDTWPWIPTFVEIESLMEEEVKDIALKLGFDWHYAMHGSVETAYQKYYDVTEQEIDRWKTITFIPIPDWLETKRK